MNQVLPLSSSLLFLTSLQISLQRPHFLENAVLLTRVFVSPASIFLYSCACNTVFQKKNLSLLFPFFTNFFQLFPCPAHFFPYFRSFHHFLLPYKLYLYCIISSFRTPISPFTVLSTLLTTFRFPSFPSCKHANSVPL